MINTPTETLDKSFVTLPTLVPSQILNVDILSWRVSTLISDQGGVLLTKRNQITQSTRRRQKTIIFIFYFFRAISKKDKAVGVPPAMRFSRREAQLKYRSVACLKGARLSNSCFLDCAGLVRMESFLNIVSTLKILEDLVWKRPIFYSSALVAFQRWEDVHQQEKYPEWPTRDPFQQLFHLPSLFLW